MPRAPRIVVPDLPHHIVQRGNDRQDIYLHRSDAEMYLSALGSTCRQFDLSLSAYCLMRNHVHVIITPHQEETLSVGWRWLQSWYARQINDRYGKTGHLWHGRFFSCVLDEPHWWAALRYVENNPVRAGKVCQAWDYPWSSAEAHVDRADPRGLLDLGLWCEMAGGMDWREFLLSGTADETERVREHTQSGRPLGSSNFLERLEKQVGRSLAVRPVGRPRKTGG